MDMTETTDNSNEHSKYVGGFLRIIYIFFSNKEIFIDL